MYLHARSQPRVSDVLQFNRRVEYGLGIVATLARNPGELHSARSVSEATHIPFDMVTKCLQRMHRAGFCEAVQGKKGGYRLTCDPAKTTLGAYISAIFEPVAVAECLAKSGSDCVLLGECDLRSPMERLNQRFEDLLNEMSLAEFLGLPATSSTGSSNDN